MSNTVAHAFHATPRNLRVKIGKLFIVFKQLGRLFADQDQVKNDGLLGSFVILKINF